MAALSGEQRKQLEKYMELILKANENINLTAVREKEAFWQAHILDSLLYAELPEIREADTVLDLGTGAGFPGIPLAVIYPEKDICLLDSVNKKLKVVKESADEAGIFNIRTVHMRAEDLGHDKEYREHFDVCVSRAVAPMNVLAELALPLVKVGGCVIAYKGPAADAELAEAQKAIKLLGGAVDRVECFSGQADTDHRALVITKRSKTPKGYPRKAGTPSKKPLR